MPNIPTDSTCCRCGPSKDAASRRGFLRSAIALACGGASLLIPTCVGIAAFLNPLRQKGSGGRFVRIASLDALPADGTPQRISVVADREDAWNRFAAEPIGAVYLLRQGDDVTALQVLCPHEGCPIGFDAERRLFKCPCHKQPEFDLSGKRTEGDASYSPRDMDSLDVEIRKKNDQREVWVKFQTFVQGTAQRTAQG